MRYLIFGVVLCFTDFVVIFEAAASRAVAAIRSGKKLEGGVSIFPAIPTMPFLAAVLAWLLDLKFAPYGLWTVGLVHAFLFVKSVIYIVWAVSWRKANENKSQPAAGALRHRNGEAQR